jgi:glycosyltransferase involved in cell wall biosynthesis
MDLYRTIEPTEPQASGKSARLKILISAFVCRPGKGSEGGTGWRAVEHLCRHHDLTVMVADRFRPEIEQQLQSQPLPNVRWAFVDLPDWVIGKKYLWRDPPHIYYYLWQGWALRAAKELHRRIGFDVAQHITFGCYWRPSVLALLDVPYVLGPVGGTENVPLRYYSTLPISERVSAALKLAAEWGALKFDPFVRRTLRRADVVIIPNARRGATRVSQLGAKRIFKLPQISLPEAEIKQLGRVPLRREATPFRLVSLGRLIGWKGIHLALQAFADFHSRYPDSEYWHVGDGPMQGHLEAMARRLGVAECFKIIEGASRQEAFDHLAHSDVLLFPSLKNEPGWVVLEAMAAGRPVVFLGGTPDVPGADQAGFTARSDRPRHSIQDLSDAMLRLAVDPDLRIRMGEAGRQLVRKHFNMPEWFAAMEEVLREVVADARARPGAAPSGACDPSLVDSKLEPRTPQP